MRVQGTDKTVWNVSCHASIMKLVEIRSYYTNKSSAFPAVSGKWMWYKAFLSQAQETYLILLFNTCWRLYFLDIMLKLEPGTAFIKTEAWPLFCIHSWLGTWCSLWPSTPNLSLLPANFATQKVTLLCWHLPFWQSWLLEQFYHALFSSSFW